MPATTMGLLNNSMLRGIHNSCGGLETLTTPVRLLCRLLCSCALNKMEEH